MKSFLKLTLAFAVILWAFCFPKSVAATMGASCCGRYNVAGIALYTPTSNGLSCTSAFSPSWIRDRLNNLNFCGVTSVSNPVLLFFCHIPDGFGALATSCEADEQCDLSTNACNIPANTATSEIQDPICPNGYKDIIDLLPMGEIAPRLAGWDLSQGRVCCKADFLDVVISPLKCLLSQKDNIVIGTSCRDSRFRFKTIKQADGTIVGKCVKLKSFEWINQNCNGSPGVDTAIGCVPTGDLTAFLKFVLKWAFFASGGIIILMIITTGYTVLTSGGNPEKLQAAKENIVALFSGLILIAFSLILLQAIGANILRLPTF